MESTLLGLGMPNVLQRLKLVLQNKGFLVQTMPTANPILVAYRKGNWWRRSKQCVIEIISINNNLTRIDITAVINGGTPSPYAEEIIEGNLASTINNSFKKVIK